MTYNHSDFQATITQQPLLPHHCPFPYEATSSIPHSQASFRSSHYVPLAGYSFVQSTTFCPASPPAGVKLTILFIIDPSGTFGDVSKRPKPLCDCDGSERLVGFTRRHRTARCLDRHFFEATVAKRIHTCMAYNFRLLPQRQDTQEYLVGPRFHNSSMIYMGST